jgi:CDP-glucose 4,6-dehydratase
MVSELGKRLRSLEGPILITGHTGFKGTWLTLLLEELEIPVVGYSLPPTQGSLFERAKRKGKILEEFGDIQNLIQFSGFLSRTQPVVIIHMAAQPLVLESYKTPLATFETNVMGTVNVLQSAFASKSVKAICVTTTDKVYRNDNSGRRFVESDALEGKDPYSASKVGTEAVVAAWQQIGKMGQSPKLISVRAGNVIGGGDWSADRLIPDLVRGYVSSSEVQIRNPSSSRPWQHVLDPLRGYLLAIEHLLKGDTQPSFNFGPDGESLTVAEIVSIMKVEWPNAFKVKLLTEATEKIEATALGLNSDAAKEKLNWTPLFSQEEAVRRTAQWWRRVLDEGMDPSTAVEMDINEFFKRLSHFSD